MDRLDQLQRLTGLVHQAGTRALNVERIQTAAEDSLEDAQTTLRTLHSELETAKKEAPRYFTWVI
jgi:F0F1-type ATP synthase membrane subunit b/b'